MGSRQGKEADKELESLCDYMGENEQASKWQPDGKAD
jgi:hypothetical protein